jgi:hypothetical protein
MERNADLGITFHVPKTPLIGSNLISPCRRIQMPIRCRSSFASKEADREEMALRFYQLKGAEAVEITYQQKLKALEDENKSDAATIARLQQERDQASRATDLVSEV